ncbi:hypothetical protein REPUB_Repub01dG0255500 [Reevesia pubescens]
MSLHQLIALSFVYVETKEWVLRKLVPSTEELKNAWSEWEVRCLVVVSLTLQVFLIITAYVRQRYQGRSEPAVAAFVWSIYLLADWVATVAMTTILRGTFEMQSALVVLWTPFLLWHLGNPANITAYSLEDNELWLRHFLGLLSNGVEAVYIYFRFRTAGAQNFVGITNNIYYFDLMVVPILICGIIKYGERIVALRCASDEQLRSGLFSEAERKHLSPGGKKMIRTGLYESAETGKDFVEAKGKGPEVKFIREARVSFEIFRPLFLGLPFEISREYYKKMVFIQSKSAEEAFQLVKLELQFLYDLFFTKNHILQRCHKLNIVLRGFYIMSALSVLIAFSLTMKNFGHIHIARADITVTYLLLAGAIFLDVYASALHLWSIWSMAFGIAGGKLHKLYYWLVAPKLRSIKSKGIRAKIAQYDMFKDFCSISKDRIFTPVINLIDPNEIFKKYVHMISWVETGDDLKEFIYDNLKEERRNFINKDPTSTLLSDKRGINSVLNNYFSIQYKLNLDEWMQPTMDFTRTVFIWHIATKLVYYNKLDRRQHIAGSSCRISNVLSDYMVYLVLLHPSMMPKEFVEVTKESFLPAKKRANQIKKASHKLASFVYSRYQKMKDPRTTINFFATNMLAMEEAELFVYLEVGSKGSITEKMDDILKVKPALVTGHMLAQGLLGLVNNLRWDEVEMWEMLSGLWMKLLIHAANHCSWKEHVIRLRHGGELLTHVSLLMAHLGLSKDIHLGAEGSDDEAIV